MDRLTHILTEICKHSMGERSIDDYKRGIADGTLALFDIDGITVGAEIHTHPQKKTLAIIFLYADKNEGLQNLEKVFKVMTDIARSLGCSDLVTYGRKGWEKVMQQYGATHQYSVFRLEVPNVIQ